MRIALAVLGASAITLTALAAMPLEEFLRDTDLIFWFLALPALGALLGAAFLALRGSGRLALASFLGTLAATELVFGGLNAWRDPEVETWVDPEYWQAHPWLGYAPRPDLTTRAWKRVDEAIVYDVTYRIDPAGRRVTPVDDREQRTRFLLFFGGSFAFGEGVDQRETLPFFASRVLPHHMPYNYGFHGYGPQQLLARLESGDLRHEIAEREGTLLYLFIDSHVNRAIGSMVVYSGWADEAPYYALDAEGEPVRRGSFTTGRFATSLFYNVAGRSQLLRYFGVELPPRIRGDHIELTARILARSARLFRRDFGPQRFAVVLFPGSTHGPRLMQALTRLGVETIDYAELLDFDRPEYVITRDGHPSPLAYRTIGDRLSEDLAPASSTRRSMAAEAGGSHRARSDQRPSSPRPPS